MCTSLEASEDQRWQLPYHGPRSSGAGNRSCSGAEEEVQRPERELASQEPAALEEGEAEGSEQEPATSYTTSANW